MADPTAPQRVTFRDALHSDVPAIRAMYLKLTQEQEPKLTDEAAAWVVDSLLPASGFVPVTVIAESDEGPLGFTRGLIHSTLPHLRFQAAPVGYVDELFVEPAQRRKGLARGLLRCLLAAFKARGVATVWTHPVSPASAALCEAYGAATESITTLRL